jgi:hypothetical protein
VTNQIRDGYEQVIEDAFAQKSLNKTAAWSSVAPTDIKGLENGHKRDNCVESKRRNLRSVVSSTRNCLYGMETDKETYNTEVDNGYRAHRRHLTYREDGRNEAWTLGSRDPDPDAMLT